ncbi:MAG TPA: protoporphyrinogen oxidase [Ignavibacteriaceae bacterium]|nr:protoporphyrinogen oxidase [Ignavibacteriaceae bacterium]
MDKKVVILGAGISGLTTGYWLKKSGFDVTILEKRIEPGGSMESVIENGFLFDRGPNSGLETSPLVSQLVEELGLKNEFIYANKKGNKRYILRNGELHALPMSMKSFIKTKLFSTKAKIRLFAEPFIGRSADGYYQSIAQFVKRRLGQEFLDYAINPFVAGVYAGKPEELSVKSAFPKLYALEEKYGGLMIGTIRSIRERRKRKEKSKHSAKMFSFKNGIQILPKKLAETFGSKLLFDCEVTAIEKLAGGYLLKYDKNGLPGEIRADAVISTITAYTLSDLMKNYDKELSHQLEMIYHPPVLVLFLTYPVSSIEQPLDGFGFLIPEKERMSFLGAIWSSVIFEKRAPEGKASFTLFVGGSRNADLLKLDKEYLIDIVITEFNKVMGINEKPLSISSRYWEKAIPQYNIGYVEVEKYFDEFEKQNPGFFLSGNFRGGISVGDCIKNSEPTARKVEEYFKKK